MIETVVSRVAASGADVPRLVFSFRDDCPAAVIAQMRSKLDALKNVWNRNLGRLQQIGEIDRTAIVRPVLFGQTQELLGGFLLHVPMSVGIVGHLEELRNAAPVTRCAVTGGSGAGIPIEVAGTAPGDTAGDAPMPTRRNV